MVTPPMSVMIGRVEEMLGESSCRNPVMNASINRINTKRISRVQQFGIRADRRIERLFSRQSPNKRPLIKSG